MVIAQSTATTEFDGMPHSAIATGLVDYELPPTAMPAQLIAYTVQAFDTPRDVDTLPPPQLATAMKNIFTVHRRVGRRAALRGRKRTRSPCCWRRAWRR